MLKLRHEARETLHTVTEASKKVISTSEAAAIALLAVAGVAVLALLLATVAITRTGRRD